MSNGYPKKLVVLIAFLLLLFAERNHAQTAQNGVCYATTGIAGNDPASLLTIDPVTGIGTVVGATGIVGNAGVAGVPGVAINSQGEIFATSVGDYSNLYRINAATGAANLVGNTFLFSLEAIAFDANDVLYGVAALEEVLYIIDPETGQTNLVGRVGAPIRGLAFDPTDGTLWGSEGAGEDGIYTIDTANGAATKIGDTGLGVSTPDIHFDENGNLFGVKGGGQGVNDLIAINKSTGAGTVIGAIGIGAVSGLAFRPPVLQGPQIGVTPPLLDFKYVEAGVGTTMKVSVNSIGTQGLIINNISVSSGTFSLSGLPSFPATLQAGNSATFDVTVTPTAPGPESATLTITSNDADNASVDVDLVARSVDLTSATPGVCYASTGFRDEGNLLTINPATGSGTFVGATGLFAVPGLAINSSGEIYGVSGFPQCHLYRIDTASGAAVFVAPLNLISADAMAFDQNDNLYAIGIEALSFLDLLTYNLYTINPQTAAVSLIGDTGDAFTGMAFDPTDGSMWVSTGSDNSANTPDGIFTMDPVTAVATLVGTTGLGSSTPDIHFDANGNLFGTKGGGINSANNLISINKSNGAGTVIGSIGFTSVSGLAFSPPDPNSVEQSDTIPNIFSLEQNYPNPFNPSTTIRYQLPEATRVSLVIFNLLGQEVRTMIKAEQVAGDYSVTWDGIDKFGKEVASGVYVYRLKAGEFTDVKKLALTR